MLRRLVEADDNFIDAQFEFELQLLTLGIERLLDADHSNDGQPASP